MEQPTIEQFMERIDALEAELAESYADQVCLEERLTEMEQQLQVALGQLAICQREQKYALIA